MGKDWNGRADDLARMGGNGNRPKDDWRGQPRGRDYHPGRSCQYEAATLITAAAVVVRLGVLTSRFIRRTRAK